MGLTFRLNVVLHSILLSFPGILLAAEIANLKTHFTDTRLTIEYDLAGAQTERESAVDVGIEIAGKKYSSHMLSMSGDFGSSIPLGSRKQIVWNHILDFPEGLDTVFKCNVTAIQANRKSDEVQTPAGEYRNSYFAVNRQTIVETRTQLMWARNANISVKPAKYPEAEKFITRLNHERYAGYTDWRIATREDFEGLVYWGKKAGWGYELAHFIADYLSTCGFDNVQPGNYWTSTPAGVTMDQQFVLNTWNGGFRPLEPANYYHIWPVRTAR